MILMKTVLVLSMIGIQLADSVEVEHHQDAEEIEYLKQLVNRLTLGQNTILKGLIKSVEKQSSKIKGAKPEVIQRIKYEVLQEAIEQEESLRELGLDDVDIEGIQWVTAKLTGPSTEEDAIAKVLKGMSNQDLKALKKNIDGKLLRGVLEQMGDDKLDTFMESIHVDQEKVLDVLEDMDEDELEAFIENMNENDKDEDLNEMINKVYDDEDIEQVMDKMSDNELTVVLKNVEDQELGELVTSMNDHDFNEVMRNLKGDTEEISMARDVVKMIQSEELDDLTHKKLEQHGKELSQSRKRRDLNDVFGENIEKNRRKRETGDGFQGFSSSDALSTITGHQKLMNNIVEKEKKSRERKRRAADILEKDLPSLGEAEERYKEPTYLAPNFEPEGDSEERKQSTGYLGLLSLFEHSRKRRNAIKKEENLDEVSDGIESLAVGDRQKRGLPGLDWLFDHDTTINSLIGHQAEPDANSKPYFNEDFFNPFTLLHSEPDTSSESYLDQDFLKPFTKFHRKPHSYPESQTTHQTQWSQWSYYEPKPEPQPEPEPEPESTYEHQPTPSAEPEHQTTCDVSDPTCFEPQPTCDGSDPACNDPRPNSPEITDEEATCDGSDPTCNDSSPETIDVEPQPTCDESDPACLETKPISLPAPKPISLPAPKPISPPAPKPISPPAPKPISPPAPKPISPPAPIPISLPAPKPISPPALKPISPPAPKPISPPAPKPISPPEDTNEEPPTLCDGSDPRCQPISPPQDTNEELPSTCNGSDPNCQESGPISTPEDIHDDHDHDDHDDDDVHHHHHTTISLGSDVYEISSPIKRARTDDTPYDVSLTEKNAPYERHGAPKKATIYLSGHPKPFKNSHMDTLNSVKLTNDRERRSLKNEEYSVPQAVRENNAPTEKLPLSHGGAPNKATVHITPHSKPLNSHMDTLKSVKMSHDGAPAATFFSQPTSEERRESARPQVSERIKSDELEKSVPNVHERGKF